MTGKSDIPDELLAEMTPAVLAFVEALFARKSALAQLPQLGRKMLAAKSFSSLFGVAFS
jgi:hypothetical protein